MNMISNREEFEISALGITYAVEKTEQGRQVIIPEEDFEKIFEKMQELQDKVTELQHQVIEELKRQALIKNILNGY